MQVDLKTLSNNFTVPHPIIFFSVLKWNSTERELLHKRRLWLDMECETSISVPVVIRGIIQKRSRVQTSINRHFQNS